MKTKSVVVAMVMVAATSTAVSTAGAGGKSATREQVGVGWHPQMAGAENPRSGIVVGAWAELVRNSNGISYSFHATNLAPGHAYTLWQVVANNPAACAIPTACTPTDFFTRALVDAQVSYAAGHVVGGSGKATFSGSQREVEAIPEGWFDPSFPYDPSVFPDPPSRGLLDATAAEVHLVLNDHGPALPDYMPGMIHTYRGGCHVSSPFPALFKDVTPWGETPRALEDGAPGPDTNICRLTQVAVFR